MYHRQLSRRQHTRHYQKQLEDLLFQHTNELRQQHRLPVRRVHLESQKCEFHDYSPLPFGCNKAAIISTGVITGFVVAAAVALAIMIFGGRKGYDYWKQSTNNKISGMSSNPLNNEEPGNELY
ncbi:hypothetical protein SAMD00019534_031870 [Acytostelium subglobosum LB1]|uniref:hypothetical protein n=1 Tax=Acytostelium subglobosum LB1 TaxID=1410327 RepID=UPI000644E371|nr:hypothetical protein SAMD00019534_031870 [Acytostelium subglobosum LB1]GAM20012.1 hypothetical protein SAMD00019534_031870 [Acytostelium subglobosum LB1]|eukprot:XP_012756774.1 hypothetical protein SAMD00019534_031870 [Acytostelium subglobosum LB1]